MEFVMNELIEKMLDENHIYQARTGMKRTPSPIRHRWKNGEKINYEMGCRIEPFTIFANGNNLFTCGSFSSMASALRTNAIVGRYTEIAPGCSMMGFRHPLESVSINSAVFNYARENVFSYFHEYETENGPVKKEPVPRPQPQSSPLRIGHDVWIGSNCTLGGVTIHTGAVVASNSVVVKDVPPYAVVAGVPAKVRKFRFPPEIIRGMLEIKWWDYELGDMYREGLDFSNPERFLSQFISRQSNIRRFTPGYFSPFLEFVVDKRMREHHGAIATSWGTVLTMDNGLCLLTHEAVTDHPIMGDVKEKGISMHTQRDGSDLLVDQIRLGVVNDPVPLVAENNLDGTISIKCGDQYLSARPKGEIALAARRNVWERFMIIP